MTKNSSPVEQQIAAITKYDPASPYWDRDHPEHQVTLANVQKLLAESAAAEGDHDGADALDQGRLQQRYGAIDDMVPPGYAPVNQEEALAFYRFADQHQLPADAVKALVREAWSHEVAGGGAPRPEDVAALKSRMVRDFDMKPETFDRLVAWYFSSSEGF